MGKVILHIGWPKTGTSAIQAFLSENKRVFLKTGVHIQTEFGGPSNLDFVAYFDDNLSGPFGKLNGVKTQEEKADYFGDFRGSFSNALQNANLSAPGADAIISSEHFLTTLTNPAQLKELRDFLNIFFDETVVLGYVRPQEVLASSLYSQHLNQGNRTGSLENYFARISIEDVVFNYKKAADLWSSVFGKRNVNFRVYEPDAWEQNDIRLNFVDWLHELGFNVFEKDFKLQEGRVNEQISTLLGSAFRAVNETVPFWNLESGGYNLKNEQLKRKLREIKALDRGKVGVSGEHLRKKFELSNKRFFEEYLPGGIFCREIEANNESFSLQEVEAIVYLLTLELLRDRT